MNRPSLRRPPTAPEPLTPLEPLAPLTAIAGAILAVLLGGAAAAEAASPGDLLPRRPHIIFILVDDLGYGDVGVFHQNARRAAGERSRPWHMTPGLDRLAAEGMTLPHHICPAPVCAPSRASLLAGVHQGHCTVRDNQFDKALDDNHTLATVLRSAGYRTIAIGKYGLQGGGEGPEADALAPDWPAHPLRRGFDEFYGSIRHRDGHEHYPKEGIHRGPKQVWHDRTEVSAGLDRCYTTDLFTARAKHAITSHVASEPDRPVFLYLAYDTPHAVLSLPTQPYPAGGGRDGGLQWLGGPGRMVNTADGEPDTFLHPDYATATWDHDSDPATPEVPWPDVQKRYATVVRRIDEGVADLLALLDDLGIGRDTLVVFTSDNGPSVESYLREAFAPTFFQGYGPYDGIKRDLWEGGVHVGAIARWPAVIRPGSSAGDHATAFWDWLPTFAETAGVPPPARTDGVSLLPLLRGEPAGQRPSTIYAEYFQNGKTPAFADFTPARRGRRRGQMQLVREGRHVGVRYDVGAATDAFEIYDIVADPRQTVNLAPQLPDLERRMQDRVLRLRMPNASAPRPYDDTPVPALDGVTTVTTVAGVAWQAVTLPAVADGGFDWVPDMAAIAADPTGRWAVRSGTATDPAAALAAAAATDEQPQPRTVLVTGLLELPETGDVTITWAGSGRAVLRIHEATVIDADFGHTAGTTRDGVVRLAAGLHPFRLTVRLDDPAAATTTPRADADTAAPWLAWAGPGLSAGPIPVDAFRRDASPRADVPEIRTILREGQPEPTPSARAGRRRAPSRGRTAVRRCRRKPRAGVSRSAGPRPGGRFRRCRRSCRRAAR
jgi:arylsulfatase A-like enzyme